MTVQQDGQLLPSESSRQTLPGETAGPSGYPAGARVTSSKPTSWEFQGFHSFYTTAGIVRFQHRPHVGRLPDILVESRTHRFERTLALHHPFRAFFHSV